jgi:hypothetical protein
MRGKKKIKMTENVTEDKICNVEERWKDRSK